MQKFILFFILSLLLFVFAAFLLNSYVLQKNYFNSKKEIKVEEITTDIIDNIPLSVYVNYSKKDYDTAILENRPVVLFFTSNWCKECLTQDKINKEVFSTLNVEGILGLNIHILDSETTTETDALAKKFDVTKENTFVFLDKKGAVSEKYVGELTVLQLEEKIMKAGDMK